MTNQENRNNRENTGDQKSIHQNSAPAVALYKLADKANLGSFKFPDLKQWEDEFWEMVQNYEQADE